MLFGPDSFVLGLTSEVSRLRALPMVGELGVRMSDISILLWSLFSQDLEPGSSRKLVGSIPTDRSLDRGTELRDTEFGLGSGCRRASLA